MGAVISNMSLLCTIANRQLPSIWYLARIALPQAGSLGSTMKKQWKNKEIQLMIMGRDGRCYLKYEVIMHNCQPELSSIWYLARIVMLDWLIGFYNEKTMNKTRKSN